MRSSSQTAAEFVRRLEHVLGRAKHPLDPGIFHHVPRVAFCARGRTARSGRRRRLRGRGLGAPIVPVHEPKEVR